MNNNSAETCFTLKYGAINDGFEKNGEHDVESNREKQHEVSNNNNEKEPIKKPAPNFTFKQKMIALAIVFGNFCVGTGFSAMGPFFPQEAERKGSTPSEYGLVFGIYQLVIFFVSPICGKIMPPVTPKFLLVTGCIIFGVCTILFGTLEWCPGGKTFLILCFVVRIIQAGGSAAFFIAGYTICALEFPERVSFLFSLSETAFGFGTAVGPAVGGSLYEAGGFYLPFLVSGIAALISSIFYIVLIPNHGAKSEESKANMMQIVLNVSLILDMMITVTTFTLLCFLEATLEPHLRQFHLSSSLVGLIFVVSGGLYALVTSVWGCICERLDNARHACIAGGVFCVISFLLVGPPPFIPLKTSLTLIIISQVFLGCGLGGCLVGSFTHSLKETIERGFPNDVSTFAVISSATTSAFSLGAFIGPSAGGIMVDTIGFEQATAVLLWATVAMMVVMIGHMIFQAQIQPRWKKIFSLPTDPSASNENGIEKHCYSNSVVKDT